MEMPVGHLSVKTEKALASWRSLRWTLHLGALQHDPEYGQNSLRAKHINFYIINKKQTSSTG